MNITPETEALMRSIARETADSAVHQTLTAYGIDPDTPLEFQKDMAHLREWRLRMEKIQEKSVMTIVVITFGVVGAAIWLGIKSKFGIS